MAKKSTTNKPDESIIERLYDIFTDYPVDFHYINEVDFHLKESFSLSKKEIQEIVEFIGATSLIDSKDDLDEDVITQTRIVHFKDYDIYIKQVRTGEGYYDSKDDYAEMSGEPTEVNYWLVEPQKKGYKIIKVI